MVEVPVFFLDVHELYAGPGGQQKAVGGLRNMATMVKPVGIYLWWKTFLGFTSLYVAARPHAGVSRAGNRSRPNQTAYHQ